MVLGLIVIVIIAGWLFSSKQADDAAMTDVLNMEEKGTIEGEKMMENKEESMMKDEDKMMEEKDAMMEKDNMMAKAGSYESYDPEKLARAETGDVVLFFRASWCPTCRTLDADIRQNMKSIPAGVSILDVDYDNSTALKQKYGVTYQHTLVQVDKDGKQIAKWTGSSTLASLLANIK